MHRLILFSTTGPVDRRLDKKLRAAWLLKLHRFASIYDCKSFRQQLRPCTHCLTAGNAVAAAIHKTIALTEAKTAQKMGRRQC